MIKKALLVLLLFITIPFLSSCEVKPKEIDIYTWDYKMVEKNAVIISYTTYVLETDYGDVQVSKKIYTNAQNGDYKEITLLVKDGEETKFIGATLIDGTPISKTLIEEIEEQIVPDEENDESE